jgi:hypothetical protein
MLRSWRESSRALAALLASLFLVSSLRAFEPALLWQSPAEQQSFIAQCQCIDGMCPLYGGPEVLPPPVYTDAPEHGYIVEQPACDVMFEGDALGCCDSVGGYCGDACGDCCWCPGWTIRGEALFWSRTSGSSVPLVTAPVVINSADFELGVAVGPRVTAIRHSAWGTCWDVEGAYFGIEDWSNTILLADADNYVTTPVINILGIAPTTLVYDSSLKSGEINLRRTYSDWVTWLVGFRWLEVDENLGADFGGGATHNLAVNNTLLGAQLGLDAMLWDVGPNLSINGVGKAGIFANDADALTTTAGIGGALPLIPASGSEASFVGEVGLNARYRWTDRLTLIGGYNLLWITGVALAPEQLATINITTGVATVSTDGSLFYHGANVGLEYVW